MTSYTLAIDTGGTFTDFALLDEGGNAVEKYKVASTPEDPSNGIIAGLQLIAQSKSIEIKSLMSRVQLIIHGTTVTTNAVLTSLGAKTALITTEGFRDILEMRRGIRPTFFDNKYTAPKPLIPRHLRFGVQERISSTGAVLIPLNKNDLYRIGDQLKAEQVEAVAVCFMHSYLNPQHEKQANHILQELLPHAYITVSSEILPQPRLYERVSTTAINSYVGPLLNHYLDALLEKLRDLHFTGTFFIVTSNGGAASPELAKKIPAATLLSGPAAGPVAALHLCQSAGYSNCLTMDMGGTSFEASLIKDGMPLTSRRAEVNFNAVSLPMMAIQTIGAGGGSIAWLDSGNFLHMGPQSSGAIPGPAAYNLGGTVPTCTDAALVMGLLDPDRFLSGRYPLSLDKASQAIEKYIATPLGISVEEAAWGMYQVIITNMANSLKELTVRKGYDPREFLLVVGGGAGPLHCAYLSRELEIPMMMIPAESSVMCAFGMLLADLKLDYVRTFYAAFSHDNVPEMLALFDEMHVRGKKESAYGESLNYRIGVTYSLDLRYRGQHNELTIAIDRADLERHNLENIVRSFHQEHNRQYGYSLENSRVPLEVLCLRLLYTGKRQIGSDLKPLETQSLSARLLGYREVYNPHARTYQKLSVWDGTQPSQEVIEGPAIIEMGYTTVFIPQYFSGQYDSFGNLLMYENNNT
ncbi:hydantoinase/oxoprolinase family protein [Desulfitobacterium sp. PCE1]|uniref:hydantoinase/oxoprolinase family protein n=1 Tax=Desulfitobacterium sp. PCE1 TaxID=146907 RepID=UPI0003696BF5|nr:hydantoinase/oxoprolinase family protein [Desulfitobacterium sp. PCE1]